MYQIIKPALKAGLFVILNHDKYFTSNLNSDASPNENENFKNLSVLPSHFLTDLLSALICI